MGGSTGFPAVSGPDIRTGGARAGELDARTLCAESVIASEAPQQAGGCGQLEVADAPAALADEVVVGRRVSVVAQRGSRSPHHVDLTLPHQELEIAIDGTHREAREARQQRGMDVGGRRVAVGAPEPREHALSLPTPMTPASLDRGGASHSRKHRAGTRLRQGRIENDSWLFRKARAEATEADPDSGSG